MLICVFRPQFQGKGCSRTTDSAEATGTSIRPRSSPAALLLHHHPPLLTGSESAPDPILIIMGRRYTKSTVVSTTITVNSFCNEMMQSKPQSKTKQTH